MLSVPVSCLPPCRMNPKVLKLNTLISFLSQVVLGHPTGLLQSVGGLSAVVITRWWSSEGAEQARCPKNLKRKVFILLFIGNWQTDGDTLDYLVDSVPAVRYS